MTNKKQRSAPRKIERQSLPETIAKLLRERILSGEIEQGAALVQDAIAQEYAVSRMPVREALRLLEAAGLVSMETHMGAVVTSISTEQIVEYFDLRAMLECDLLERAIPNITEENLTAARAALTALESSYEERDVARWGQLNWEFHRSLYIASGRMQTLGLLHGINLQVDRFVRLQLLLTEAVDVAQKEHRELLHLCSKRNANRAVSFLRKHILNAGCNLRLALLKSRASHAA